MLKGTCHIVSCYPLSPFRTAPSIRMFQLAATAVIPFLNATLLLLAQLANHLTEN